MTERVLNTSVKQPLGVSPNTLLFGNDFSTDLFLLTQLDRDVSNKQPRSIRDFVDTLIERQAKLIDAAIQSQTSLNTANLRKRYQTYSRAPKLCIVTNVLKRIKMIIRAPLTQCPSLTL